jgi:hypothetical protein
MKKNVFLFFVLFAIALNCNAGSFIDGYRSIGYWIGGGASLIAEKGTYERHRENNLTYYSFSQKIINIETGMQTSISSSHGDDLNINDIYHIKKWDLLEEVGITVNGPSKSNVSVYVLPNDNILYIVELERSIIKGAIKLQDRVEQFDGQPLVIEGATVPIKETEYSCIGFILESEGFYRSIRSFKVPTHTKFVSSVNGRMYFLNETVDIGKDKKGFTRLYCYDLDGNYLWQYYNTKHSEWFCTLQETIDNLYMAGAEQTDDESYYGVIRVLSLKDGNTISTQYDNKAKSAYYIDSNYFKDGFDYGYELPNDKIEIGRMNYIKEDAIFKAKIEEDWDEMQANLRKKTEKSEEIISNANLESVIRNMFNEANDYKSKIYEDISKQEKLDCLRKADALFEKMQNTPNVESVMDLDFIKMQRENVKKKIEEINGM